MELIPIHDRKHLLNYARNIIEHNLIGRPVLDHFIPLSCEKEYGGVFVSIYVEGNLRGCMGKFTEMEALIDLVRYMSNEVLKDERFEPVKPHEVPFSAIEISIISELKKTSDHNEIELGKHGIHIRGKGKTGTYLPSVAVDQGWTIGEFVHSCIFEKAGITDDSDVKLYKFETDIFKEEKL